MNRLSMKDCEKSSVYRQTTCRANGFNIGPVLYAINIIKDMADKLSHDCLMSFSQYRHEFDNGADFRDYIVYNDKKEEVVDREDGHDTVRYPVAKNVCVNASEQDCIVSYYGTVNGDAHCAFAEPFDGVWVYHDKGYNKWWIELWPSAVMDCDGDFYHYFVIISTDGNYHVDCVWTRG